MRTKLVLGLVCLAHGLVIIYQLRKIFNDMKKKSEFDATLRRFTIPFSHWMAKQSLLHS
jgi:hypothetical protein